MGHPWQEMRRLQREMEQLFGDLAGGARAPLTGEYPPLNLTRDDMGITLEALCPGVDRGTLDTTVVGDTVTIRGERKVEPDVLDDRYHRRERVVGAFTRTVSLGERLDPDRAQATYANGILRVRLGRAPEAKPKKIAIQS
jgi:HSP20 family protein